MINRSGCNVDAGPRTTVLIVSTTFHRGFNSNFRTHGSIRNGYDCRHEFISIIFKRVGVVMVGGLWLSQWGIALCQVLWRSWHTPINTIRTTPSTPIFVAHPSTPTYQSIYPAVIFPAVLDTLQGLACPADLSERIYSLISACSYLLSCPLRSSTASPPTALLGINHHAFHMISGTSGDAFLGQSCLGVVGWISL